MQSGYPGRLKIQLRIEYQCHQCGAPAILEETDRLFRCEFCRVKSYLIPPDVFRYVLPSAAPASKDLIYFPYWRFKGMLYALGPAGIRNKFIDISHQAISCRHVPVSVGLRSQALKLRFVLPDSEGRFLKPVHTIGDTIASVGHRFAQTLPKPVWLQAHIGESVSLLYAPFYIENQIFDAVLNQPLSVIDDTAMQIEQLQGGAPDWKMQLISALCPKCGWDLDGTRDALVLDCHNCSTAWYPLRGILKELKFGQYASACREDSIFLPFWRIRTSITGINLRSLNDLIQVANLPKVPRKEWDDVGFRFWIPAFKIRPQVYLRLATVMTLSQPHLDLESRLPPSGHPPVNMPINEALESLKMTLANFMKPRQSVADHISQVDIRAKSVVLVYMPFAAKHHEFVQPDLQIAINRNLLRLSKNL